MPVTRRISPTVTGRCVWSARSADGVWGTVSVFVGECTPVTVELPGNPLWCPVASRVSARGTGWVRVSVTRCIAPTLLGRCSWSSQRAAGWRMIVIGALSPTIADMQSDGIGGATRHSARLYVTWALLTIHTAHTFAGGCPFPPHPLKRSPSDGLAHARGSCLGALVAELGARSPAW